MPVVKQYVNLPSGTTNVHGMTRDLRVTPNTVPNVGPGDRVEWWVEPVGASNTPVEFIGPTRRARVLHAETTLDASGAFLNQLSLPHVGGDRYLVKVSKKGQRSSALQTEEIETWRKLYYSLFYMGNPARDMFNGMEADFRQAFTEGGVEIENVQKVATLTELARVDLSTGAAIGRVDFHFMGGAGQSGGIIDLAPVGTGTLASKPFHVAIVVVPNIFRLKDLPKAFRTTAAVGTTQVATRLHTNVPPEPADPRAFVYTAAASWAGQPPINVKPNLSLVGAPTDTRSEFRWDLRAVPGVTSWLATAGHDVLLDLSLVEESTVMGYSTGNLCVVRTVDGTTDVLQTFTHELGHGIQQTVRHEPRWDASGSSIDGLTNQKWHTDNFGGRGNHCSKNAVLSAVAPPPGLTSVYRYGGSGRLCTMFFSGESHVEPKGKFCAEWCLPRIKRVALDTTAMNAKFWNYFG